MLTPCPTSPRPSEIWGAPKGSYKERGGTRANERQWQGPTAQMKPWFAALPSPAWPRWGSGAGLQTPERRGLRREGVQVRHAAAAERVWAGGSRALPAEGTLRGVPGHVREERHVHVERFGSRGPRLFVCWRRPEEQGHTPRGLVRLGVRLPARPPPLGTQTLGKAGWCSGGSPPSPANVGKSHQRTLCPHRDLPGKRQGCRVSRARVPHTKAAWQREGWTDGAWSRDAHEQSPALVPNGHVMPGVTGLSLPIATAGCDGRKGITVARPLGPGGIQGPLRSVGYVRQAVPPHLGSPVPPSAHTGQAVTPMGLLPVPCG